MINLMNDLTLQFVWLIHNFQDKMVDIRFRVLPTIGSVVSSTMSDWLEFSLTFTGESPAYEDIVGKSKNEVWSLILGEWVKFKAGQEYERTLQYLFEYVDNVGIRA